jgi:hypothetical protein
VGFVFYLDRDRIIAGASVPTRRDRPVRMPVTDAGERALPAEVTGN